MKKLLIALAAVFITAASYGQGQLLFATSPSGINAPVTLQGTDEGPGPGYTAQLFLSQNGSLTPLTPATTFRAPGPGAQAIASRYVLSAGTVVVPGVPGGQQATLVMRAWRTDLGSADAAAAAGLLGSSAPFTITLGGAGDPPSLPSPLTGLTGFTVPVPEPSVIALGVLGATALLLRRRK